MPEFLTFCLVAPMASFGALAVGERRPSADRPARSAILGLVAACLGLTRDDEAAQSTLAEQYGVAVLCHAPGRLLADYHTTQVPPAVRRRRFGTRAEELAAPDPATILSRRDYRVGAWHLGSLWARAEAPRWSLAALADAMRAPAFTTSLGRKSCPLGLPLAPRLAEAADPAAALVHRHANGPEQRFRDRMADTPGVPIVARDVWNGEPGFYTELRRDQPRSRARWQFDLRYEVLQNLPPDPLVGADRVTGSAS